MMELPHWAIKYWACREGWGGSAFTVYASPEFLIHAKAVGEAFDQERFQAHAEMLCKDAGMKYGPVNAHLMWGEFGLEHWSVPGNACGMDVVFERHGWEVNGLSFTPHNIDSAHQQAVLLAIWMAWAGHVETTIPDRR